MARSFKAPPGSEAAPGWAQAAGYALGQVDQFLGKLGKPIGIASYKPFQSSGADFLQNYLGNIGIPIDLVAHFPAHAPLVLLTREADADPGLVEEIKARLRAGGDVIITSGLLHALERVHRGIRSVAEITYCGAGGDDWCRTCDGDGKRVENGDARLELTWRSLQAAHDAMMEVLGCKGIDLRFLS
jgi:hypothetical protein